jgi:hypothetical protein
MRLTSRTLGCGAAVLLLSAACAASATAAPLAGTYAGKGSGVKASLTLAENGGGRLAYTLKTNCGKAKGKVKLEAAPGDGLKGKSKTAKVRLGQTSTPSILKGSISYRADGPDDGPACKAKHDFIVTLDASSSPTVDSTVGHYSGVGEDGGLPIEFDVTYDADAGAFQIANLGFDTSTDCYDAAGDDLADPVVVRIRDLSGEVDSDGAFEIDYAPDEDTDYYVDGVLADGTATMDLEVGGYFLFDGTPLTSGADPDALECDSWGETYDASRG